MQMNQSQMPGGFDAMNTSGNYTQGDYVPSEAAGTAARDGVVDGAHTEALEQQLAAAREEAESYKQALEAQSREYFLEKEHKERLQQ